ncbi:tetraspanin-33-like [Gigantopelta aegis]|uniref:tetraspanin-33-like n=1 Tax=Gigantopelta aegis TaxID=1735272 RepID=UPI001B88A30F|nr:tetraspanin-33-like [Gigantopelta aegis]XP_041352532.1 tetraspanin-33-like [Gigantopelta aegis]
MDNAGEITLETSDSVQYRSDSAIVSPTWTDRCTQCDFWVKYCLFTINFLVWFLGGVMIAIGVWARVQKQGLGAFDNLITDPAFMIIAVGIVMFIISVFGCVGALRENICLLKTFIIVIVLVFVLQIAVGIVAFVFLDSVEHKMMNYMRLAVFNYFNNADTKDVIDFLQKEFTCCGAASYEDWESNVYFNCSSNATSRCGVPKSCCRIPSSFDCGYGVRRYSEKLTEQFIFNTGCIGVLMVIFKDNLVIIGFIAMSVGLLELFSLFLAHNMARHILVERKIF